MLSSVTFPVFRIPQTPDKKIKEENNVVYVGDKILDNRNLPYDTLSDRRLRIPKQDRYRLSKGYRTVKPLIARTDKYFIDSVGVIFKYVPTTFHKLIYRKIVEIINDSKYYYVFVYGIDVYFKIPLWYNISRHQYLGIIVLGKALLVYEITDENKKDTRKKV